MATRSCSRQTWTAPAARRCGAFRRTCPPLARGSRRAARPAAPRSARRCSGLYARQAASRMCRCATPARSRNAHWQLLQERLSSWPQVREPTSVSVPGKSETQNNTRTHITANQSTAHDVHEQRRHDDKAHARTHAHMLAHDKRRNCLRVSVARFVVKRADHGLATGGEHFLLRAIRRHVRHTRAQHNAIV